MGENPSAEEVESALTNSLNNVELKYSDHAGGLRVSAHPAEAGQFFETLREEGIDFEASRVGDHIVAHIEAEQDNTLGALFR